MTGWGIPERHATGVVTGSVAVGVGLLTVASPLLATAAGFGFISVFLLALGRRSATVFFAALTGLLAGYMFLGRGFAHVGVSPIFVGEVVLALGVISVLALFATRRLGALEVVLLAFMGWGLVRTLPYIGRDGVDALRDAALWGYGLFAIAVSLAVQRRQLGQLLGLYRRAIPLFVLWVPVAAGLYFFSLEWLPRSADSDVPLFVFKGGDTAVHLAAVASFILLGLYQQSDRKPRIAESLIWLAWFVGVAIAVSMNRGGLVALACAVAVAFFIRSSTRSSTRRLQFLGVAAVLLSAFALFDPKIGLGDGHEISLERLGVSSMSVVTEGAVPGQDLEGTEKWRLAWWDEIVSYTVEGPYFWTGKGFGVNLADDDGFQVFADHSLRAPHNSHLTVLARMGVPGFALWLGLQLGFAAALVRALTRARRAGAMRWVQLNGWLLVFWLAIIINTSFDPYLEGPQGGIWFWSVFGVGLAALRIQQRGYSRREEVAL